MSASDLLAERIERLVPSPIPLWDTALTEALVSAKYSQILSESDLRRETYSTGNATRALGHKVEIGRYFQNSIFLEIPDVESDAAFYRKFGLVPLAYDEIQDSSAITKLSKAFEIFSLVPECQSCLALLINCIQVIKSDGPEFDASYSHPKIPFSIFVSVCTGVTSEHNLRVAESLLHEAMHLKLSLIESYAPIVKHGVDDLFYSPWRGETRPLSGVLHGMFVFRAIYDFFSILKAMSLFSDATDFLSFRLEQIQEDFLLISEFVDCPGLTIFGKRLSSRLLL